MTKRALIVDDSKTAQLRLRKMLEKFDVEIDMSNSAEEALGYLSYRQPAVIFLDHHMEGMSGLSALKIIKSNPSTALIPVVMYTSEKGDVYVGQARALGALDIISKEVIQYSSIEKVLSSLGVTPKGSIESPPAEDVDDLRSLDVERDREALPNYDGAAARVHVGLASTDLIKVQSQVGKLFEIHMAKVRQEIEDSTKFLMRRLSKEIQENGAVKAAIGVNGGAAASLEESDAQPSSSPVKSSMLLPVVLTLVCAFVGYQMFSYQKSLDINNVQLGTLVEQGAQQQIVKDMLQKLNDSSQVKGGPDSRVMLDALGWAVNVNPQIPFGEKPLGDERIYMLGELLALLKAANFSGTIFIDLHAGNYCVVRAPSGEWMLPDPDTNTEDCLFLADQGGKMSLNDQVSVGFINYLHSAPVLNDGSISVELSSIGFDSPKFSYPPLTSATSAGQWNQAAAQNSRLSFSFSPE